MTFKRILLTLLISIGFYFNGEAQVADFEIEYPYSDYAEWIHVDENTGYVWLATKDDILMLEGNRWLPLNINEYNKGKRVALASAIIVDHTVLFHREDELVSMDYRSKATEEIWKCPETHKIWKIHYDINQKGIWIFTQNKETNILSVFCKSTIGAVEHKFDLPDFGIKSIFQARYFFEATEELFYFFGPYSGVFVCDKEGNEVNFGKENQLHDWKSCYVFRLDNKDQLWRIKGLQYERYNSVTKSFEKHPVSGKFTTTMDCGIEKILGKKITSIYESANGLLWLGFEDSNLFYHDTLMDKLRSLRQPLVEELQGGGGDIKSLIEDRDGNLWGNKRGGLFKIREKEKYFDSYLVNTDDKNHPMYEGEKNPFINKVVAFYKESGIRRSSIDCISEDSNEDLYIPNYRFVYRLEKGKKQLELLPIFKGTANLYIYSDDKENKLLSVWNAYYTFDSTLTLSQKKAPLRQINTVYKRKNGDLLVSGWADNKGKRLFAKLNPETMEYEGNMVDPKGEIDFDYHRIYSIDEDDEGHLLLGSNAGLLKFHTQEGFKEQYYSYKYKGDEIKISFNQFNAHYIGQDKVWIKTENEIILFNMKSREVEYLLHKSDIEVSRFMSVLPVDEESVWVGDTEGLFYYNFKTKKLVRFYKNEGLAEGAFVQYITKLKDGRLAFGSENGFYIAHPDSLMAIKESIKATEKKYEMKLSSFSYLDGKTEEIILNEFVMDTPQDIHLNHNDKVLKLQYFVNNYNSINRQAYSYKLEGFDKDWSTRSRSNRANYASLPPGEYTFKARGAASGDNWSEQLLSIPIIVHEAWYRTWWFYLLCLIGLGFIIYSILNYLFQARLKKREQIERLRSKISSDLHDDVGSLLSSLAWQTDMISMTADNETQKKFSKISGLSRQAMERMRDTVWAIDSRKDDTLSLVERMMDFLVDQFEQREMSYKFDHDNFTTKSEITPDVRQNIYLIFKESVVNALKHSTGDLLTVKLHAQKGKLVLVVKDNGEVDAQSIKKSGLGLSNMIKRAKQINGDIQQNWNDGFELRLEV